MRDAASIFRHTMEALFNPFLMILIVFAFLIVWLCLYGDSRTVRAGLCLVFAGLIVFSTGWLPKIISDTLQRRYPVITKVDPSIHWVVVLGGGQLRHVDAPVNYLLTPISVQRLLEGVSLYRQLPEGKLIVSGGGEIDETESEAAHLASLAKWFSIPSKDLVLESTSINTADEAAAIKQWVHQDPFYLVTSSIHMTRSMALCRRQGLNPVAAPSDYPYDQDLEWHKNMVPHPIHLLNINVAWHEILGWVWGKVTGKI